MAEEQTAQQENQQGNDQSKVEKRFFTSMEKISAMITPPTEGGEAPDPFPKKKPKIPEERVNTIMEEVFAERSKAFEEEFKKEAKNLLDSWFKFLDESEKAEQEYNKGKAERMRKFAEQAENLSKKVEGIDAMLQRRRQRAAQNNDQQA